MPEPRRTFQLTLAFGIAIIYGALAVDPVSPDCSAGEGVDSREALRVAESRSTIASYTATLVAHPISREPKMICRCSALPGRAVQLR
jgi:hypothetical protein